MYVSLSVKQTCAMFDYLLRVTETFIFEPPANLTLFKVDGWTLPQCLQFEFEHETSVKVKWVLTREDLAYRISHAPRDI